MSDKIAPVIISIINTKCEELKAEFNKANEVDRKKVYKKQIDAVENLIAIGTTVSGSPDVTNLVSEAMLSVIGFFDTLRTTKKVNNFFINVTTDKLIRKQLPPHVRLMDEAMAKFEKDIVDFKSHVSQLRTLKKNLGNKSNEESRKLNEFITKFEACLHLITIEMKDRHEDVSKVDRKIEDYFSWRQVLLIGGYVAIVLTLAGAIGNSVAAAMTFFNSAYIGGAVGLSFSCVASVGFTIYYRSVYNRDRKDFEGLKSALKVHDERMEKHISFMQDSGVDMEPASFFKN